MLCGSVSSTSSAGSYRIIYPVFVTLSQQREYHTRYSALLDDRSTSHFHPVYHIKVDSDVYHLSPKTREEMDALVQPPWKLVFCTGKWRSEESATHYIFECETSVGGFHPPLRTQDIAEFAGAAVTTFRNRNYNVLKPNSGTWTCRARFSNSYDARVLTATWFEAYSVDGFHQPTNISWSYTTNKNLPSFDLRPVDFSRTIAQRFVDSERPLDSYEGNFQQTFGELTPKALDGLRSSCVNMWEFLGDVNLLSQVADVGRAAGKVLTNKTLKEMSDLYLTYSFGAASTARDYKELAENVATFFDNRSALLQSRYLKSQARSRTTTVWKGYEWTCDNHITAYINNQPKGLKGLATSLRSWGLYPDLATVWELVPFSFVVDWFVNLGDLLATSDADNWRQMYDIAAVICSTKMQATATMDYHPDALYVGSYTISLYERNVKREFPRPWFDLDIGLPKGEHQWLAGAALAIQKLLK